MVPAEAGQRLYTQIAGAMRNSNQFRTKTQPPKLHKPSESVRPKNFLPSTSGSITAGRSHFLHCTILVNSRVNPTTQSRKARHCSCYPKNYLVCYRIWIAIREEFLASQAAKCDRSDFWRNQSSRFKPTVSMAVNSTLDCLQWKLPIAPAFGAWCLAE